MSIYATECLEFFGVNYKIRLITRANNLPRGNQLVTGAVNHTEGVPSVIEGDADRTLYHWFNDLTSSYTHGYITFSGLYELYVPWENKCTGTGNADTNAQTVQTEFQDNGKYNQTPPPYTDAQIETGARVYCAIKLFAKDKYGVEIKFGHGKGGLERHRDIDFGRPDCARQIDNDKILARAKQIWDEKFNFEDPNMIKQLQEQVVQLQKDVEIKDSTIEDLRQANNGLNIKLESAITTQNDMLEQIGVLQREIKDLEVLRVELSKFKSTIWYSFYFLFSKDGREGKGSVK